MLFVSTYLWPSLPGLRTLWRWHHRAGAPRCQVVELAKEVAVLKTVLEVERDYTARLRTRLGLGKQAAA